MRMNTQGTSTGFFSPPDHAQDTASQSVDDAQGAVDGVGEEVKQEGVKLGEGILRGSNKVLFYVASRFDWQPLHRFSHLADVFVYVEPTATTQDITNALEAAFRTGATAVGDALKKAEAVGNPEARCSALVSDGLKLKEDDLYQLFDVNWISKPLVAARQRDGRYGFLLNLQRTVGGQPKTIWLIYLVGCPLNIYQKLFIEKKIALEMLIIGVPHRPYPENIPQPGGHILEEAFAEENDRLLNGWRQTFSWDGQFGQLIRAHSGPMPSLAAIASELGWPVNPARYNLPVGLDGLDALDMPYFMFTGISTLGHYQCPLVEPAHKPGQRHVTITRKHITPQSARSVEAIVVGPDTLRKFQGDRWPDNLLTILDAPILPEPAPEPGDDHLDLRNKPLRASLQAIEDICAAQGKTSVAVHLLPGFEDEVEDLLVWRQEAGQIKRIVFHVACNGHYFDYARAADVLD